MRFIVFFFLSIVTIKGQILNTDAILRSVDSTKRFYSIIDFGFNLNKQNTLLISLDSKADFSIRIKQNTIISSSSFALYKTGSVNLVNGGYSHLRFRMLENSKVQPELFFQYQLDGIRGMEERILSGLNCRIRFLEKSKISLFSGLGLMYEYENWNFSGIRPDALPGTKNVQNSYLKLNSYISFRQKLSEYVVSNFVLYFQTRPDSYFVVPRISSDAQITFKLNKNISFSMRYNLFYDAAPPVPIYNWYYSVINKIVFNF